MANDKGSFVVVVRTPAPTAAERRETDAATFWNQYQRSHSTPSSLEVSVARVQSLENSLRLEFPTFLRSKLRDHMLVGAQAERSTDEPPRKGFSLSRLRRMLSTERTLERDEARIRALLRRVQFRVNSVQYGSAILGVDIEGVQALLELFQKSYDSVRIFLENNVPVAIAAAVGMSPMPLPVELRDIKIPGAELQEKSTMLFGTTFRAWAITNFSLVVPTVLATLFVYWAVTATTNERERLIKGWETLGEKHESAMAGERQRVVRLVESHERLAIGLVAKERECCLPRPAAVVASSRPCPPVATEATRNPTK